MLPKNYKAPEGNYYKLKDGDNTFRVVSDAITGYEYWNTDGKPVRSADTFAATPNIRMIKDENGYEFPDKVKHFWAFLIWNYDANKVQLMEVTQRTIQDALVALEGNKKWGNVQDYDLTITRSGSGFDTTYQVVPNPKEELDSGIVAKIELTKINLEALYEGKDPFLAE
jgi:hypothetical protein